MNLLLRVFREPLLSVSSQDQNNEENAQVLFGSILDLYSNMRILLDTLETEDEDIFVSQNKADDLPGRMDSKHTNIPDATLLQHENEGSVVGINLSVSNDDSTRNCSTYNKFINHQENGMPLGTRKRNSRNFNRLVGVSLIELAEDDSLHAFSDYATTVLDPTCRDRAWELSEHESVIQSFCRVSRTILHTASLSKVSFSIPVWPLIHFFP